MQIKQLDVDVSPPAFLWNPYLSMANVTFDLCQCLYSSLVHKVALYHCTGAQYKVPQTQRDDKVAHLKTLCITQVAKNVIFT